MYDCTLTTEKIATSGNIVVRRGDIPKHVLSNAMLYFWGRENFDYAMGNEQARNEMADLIRYLRRVDNR